MKPLEQIKFRNDDFLQYVGLMYPRGDYGTWRSVATSAEEVYSWPVSSDTRVRMVEYNE
jgi:hypothetical protein